MSRKRRRTGGRPSANRPQIGKWTSRESSRGIRFWRSSLVLCAALALVALGLGAAGMVRRPDLVSATIAADRAVAAAGERLVLKGRLPLAPVQSRQVTVTPAMPFAVQTKDRTVTIRFSGPLAYGTEYRVDIAGVRSEYTKTKADWSHRFSTPPASLYTLIAHRGDDTEDDTVVSNDGDERRTLLTAPDIESYVAVRGSLVAISHPGPKSSALVAVNRADGTSVAVNAPAASLLTDLNASPDGTRFGYLSTGKVGERAYSGTLFVGDAGSLAAPPMEVTAGGAPLSVKRWLFVPGVNAVVVITPQEQAFQIYLDGGTPPVPLGKLAQLVGFLPGTSTLIAEADGKQSMIDLAGGRNSEIEATPNPDKNTHVGRRSFRFVGDYVAEFNTFTRSGGRSGVTTRLANVTRAGTTDLLTVRDGQGQLMNSGLSPNGQFAWAVVLDPDAPLTDRSSGASDHAKTVIFDLATGERVASVAGSSPVWAS